MIIPIAIDLSEHSSIPEYRHDSADFYNSAKTWGTIRLYCFTMVYPLNILIFINRLTHFHKKVAMPLYVFAKKYLGTLSLIGMAQSSLPNYPQLVRMPK